MSLEKEFVPYDRVLRLKALGFDEPCFGYYDGAGRLMIKEMPHCIISAPTFSQAFRWFREKYNKLSVTDHATGGWYFVIREIGGSTDPMLKAVCGSGFKSYEEAELACLDKLIEIVESQKTE